MSLGINKVNELDEHYKEAYYAWNSFYPLANIDLRMYLGDQWSDDEKKKLTAENRNQWVFNLTRKNINVVDGYQRSHRLSSVVLPQESKDQQAADDLSDLLMYVFQYGDGYKMISDAFSGGIKTGWNLCTVWMDYREDPINGDIKFGREPYSGFITDPYFTNLDFSDCSYIIKRKYMSPARAASLLPGYEEMIGELHKIGWSRDDKFTWLPYQTQPGINDFVAYTEHYKQIWKPVDVIVDMETGEYTEWKGPADALKYHLKTYPQLKVVKQQKRAVEVDIIVNDVFIKTEENQYGLDEYPFVPFVGTFEPESDEWSLKLQSLIRPMVDPQRETNRRLSQMTDILDSQINSGWIAQEDSVINPRSLYQTSQGKVVWTHKNAPPGSLEKIQPANIPSGMFQLQEIYSKGMSEILGINDASFGIPESGNDTGLMMMMRQASTVTNLQGVFDNLRSAQKHLSKKVIKLIQTWTPEKMERILGRKPSEQLFSEDFIKYDISVQEGMLTDTQRQTYFRQLMDLKQMTDGPSQGPITSGMLIKAAPIQNSSQLQREVEQNEQSANQQAQESQALQMKVLEAQMENTKASSVELLGRGKANFTRAVANMGLEDERAAEAIDNRASAALDRAKAMTELSNLDDDRLIKYLQIVRLMEQSNRVEEEKVKEDDVEITTRGTQSESPIADNPLAGGQQGLINPNQEVPNGQETI